MCGLVGVLLSPGGVVQRRDVARMLEVIQHRGPDDHGILTDGPLGLGHVRLSIIDLATGHQPMSAGGVSVVFNGEIYNYIEIREELKARGHSFVTTSDTEVLLHAYLEWGPEFVERLNGMFAFLLVDPARGRALAARDHFGIKPLYLHCTHEHVLAASEIKALLRHPGVRAEADPAGLADYLTLQYVPGGGTLFKGVRKVRPGHYALIDLNDLKVRDVRYWQPCFRVDLDHTEAWFIEKLRELLEDSVRLQLRSDVPLGAHLSGGTDSSLVVLLASRLLGGPLATFTGAFDEGPAFDERRYARQVAALAGAQAHEVVGREEEFIALLPKLVWHMDEPAAGPGLFPQYVVSRLAREHVKVVLGGQGGDEIFGGYARYVVAYLEQALKGAVYQTTEEGEHIVSLASILPNLPYLEPYVPMLRGFWGAGVFEDMDKRYFRLIDRSRGLQAVLTPGFREELRLDDVFPRFQLEFNHPDTQSYYNKMTHYDLVANLPALLHVEDRVSMANSLESRVPILDRRIVELVASMPPAMKFRGAEAKYILKRAAHDVVPPAILDRKDKMGFPVPLHLWARQGARGFFRDVLLSGECRSRGLFEPVVVEALFDTEEAYGRHLWGLVNLELWFRTFID
jgi:asparagine synthase (glutamine-hydrolysing)